MNRDTKVPTLEVSTLKQQLEQQNAATLIDVRSAAEFRGAHVAEARHLVLHELSEESVKRIAKLEEEVFLICQSGGRSAQACEKLLGWGFGKAVSVEGGMNAWQSAGYEVKRDESAKEVMSIERQVRIAAGALVVLGVILGWQVHAGFLILAAFVGAGLVFAGISNTCGMAMMLAKMPWNK